MLGGDYSREQSPKDRKVRSRSRDRGYRDSQDSVAYDKVGEGDEVSIGVTWSGDGVSMSTSLVHQVKFLANQDALDVLPWRHSNSPTLQPSKSPSPMLIGVSDKL